MVRRTGNAFECTLCGEPVDCPPHAKPVTVIIQSSGKPTIRSILCDGVEVHRCDVGSPLQAAVPRLRPWNPVPPDHP